MTEMLQRDIGSLIARMNAHDERLDKLEETVTEGFASLHDKLDELGDAESERRGASKANKTLLRIIALIVGTGGIWEIVRVFVLRWKR